MTRTIVEPLPHDVAVVAALESIGKPVGFAEAPAGALRAVQDGTGPDYYILYPLSSTRGGSMSDPYADAGLLYQVTCVGRLGEGARWLAGQIEAALLTVSIAGRRVRHVEVESDGFVRPDEDVQPPVFVATPSYRIHTTPA